MLTDPYNRKINYLRLSVTDRCSLRCVYCMPAEGIELLEHEDILRFEEIVTFTEAAVAAGFSKIRITGGEPLVRKDIVSLVKEIASIKGLEDLSLTTNGILLEKYALPLKEAGLKRVNISLDSLDKDIYAKMTRGGDVNKVKTGIEKAISVGLSPVKLNAVIIKGLNEDIEALINLVIKYPVDLRFIELMPYKDYDYSFVPYGQLMKTIEKMGKLSAVKTSDGKGPAKYFKLQGAKGKIGFISGVSQEFCGECNRLRLTSDGNLRSCLFSENEIDVKKKIREGALIEELKTLITQAVLSKPKEHPLFSQKVTRKGMSQVGG